MEVYYSQESICDQYGAKDRDLKNILGESFEHDISNFVLENADQVVQFVRPDRNAVSEEARELIDASLANPQKIYWLKRIEHSDMFFLGGQRVLFYRNKLKVVDGVLVSGEPLTNLWIDLLSNNLHKEGGVVFPKSKKPESLIKRCIELCTEKGDLVLDSFLGSGTTVAVAHKLRRAYIGIEQGEHARTKCAPRLQAVIDGEQGGISKAVNWQGGGGFRFYRLGKPVFDEEGKITGGIRFEDLAAHIWFSETRTPLSKQPGGPGRSPLLGLHDGSAYFLLYNGVLGDKRPRGGNVLTRAVFDELRALLPKDFAGPWVVYGESARLADATLKALVITFKQIPYDVRAR